MDTQEERTASHLRKTASQLARETSTKNRIHLLSPTNKAGQPSLRATQMQKSPLRTSIKKFTFDKPLAQKSASKRKDKVAVDGAKVGVASSSKMKARIQPEVSQSSLTPMKSM